jgi:6-phosphofructo-2-kinase / fructose-2,6-biphosphatase 2
MGSNPDMGDWKADMANVTTGDCMRPSRKTNSIGIQAEDTKICVVMVGLPARGKSYIAQKRKLIMTVPGPLRYL